MKLQPLPRNAAEWQAWINYTSDAVTSCSADPDRAFELMAKAEHPDTKFEDLALVPPRWQSMNAKLRTAMSKLLIGGSSDKTPELVSLINKRRDELKRAATPQQITGLQMVFLVKQFYQINEKDRVVFELSALIKFEYQGDAKLPWWKDHWDKMVRHCVTNLEDKDKLGMLVEKLKPSERLKPHLEYLERLPETHPEHSYTWLSGLVDKLVADDRRKGNVDS